MGDYDDDYFDGNKNAGKKVIATKITGKVKWYNVKKGYGFIHRDDIDEDVFVHQTAILRVQPGKNKSLGDDEDVLFDVVKGLKGSEAINVTGPSGEAVRGSIYASWEGSGYQRRDRNVNDNNSPYEDNSYSRGRGTYRGRGRGLYNSYENHDDDDNQFGGEPRPRGRGGRGQYSSYQNSESRDYNYIDDEGKDRGRGGYSRGSRGGSDMSDVGYRGRRPSRRNFGRGF